MELIKAKYPHDSTVYDRYFVRSKTKARDGFIRFALRDYLSKSWLSLLCRVSARSLIEINQDCIECQTLLLLHDESVEEESLFVAYLSFYVMTGKLPKLKCDSLNLSWRLKLVSWFATGSKNLLVVYKPYDNHTDVALSGPCSSAWFSSPSFNRNFNLVFNKVDVSINEERVILTKELAKAEVFESLIFDKPEHRCFPREALIGIVAIVVRFDKKLSRSDLIRRVLRIANLYSDSFTEKDVSQTIEQLVAQKWLNTDLLLTSCEVYYKAVTFCLPYLGLISLVTMGISSTVNTNAKSSSEELIESIQEFEQLIPVTDLVHIPFDEGSLDDYLNKTFALLVGQGLLDTDNVDLFSGWWDVDQDITSGTLLYFQVPCSTWPNLPQILKEPIRLLVRSALQLLGALFAAKEVRIEKLHCLYPLDYFLSRNIRFYTRENILSIENQTVTVSNAQLLTETIEKLILFDS